jgi:hypothetical protein
MDVLPSLQQEHALLRYNPHGATDLAAGHVVGPDQHETSLGAHQVDLGFTTSEHMNMRRQMIIKVDDDAQALGSEHSNHVMK